MEEKIIKSGTTTVGIVCKSGLILAADKRTTAGGMMITNKKKTKIEIVDDHIAMTFAGLVSDIQLLTKLIRAQLRLDEMRRSGRKASVKEAANLLAGLIYQNIRKMSPIAGITGFIFGGIDKTGFHLYDLGIDGSITEIDDYASDGSGMMYALGVLEVGYKEDMSLEEGTKLAIRAVNAAMQRDTSSGDGIDVVTITDKGIKKVFTKELVTTIKV